jgi:CheY-like chemotaxis protein
MMMKTATDVLKQVQSSVVLVIEDNAFMRSLMRGLLTHIGVKTVYEAADGVSGLELIATLGPTLVLLDWELPLLTGAEMMRLIRAPKSFPFPDLPVIMVTGHAERWRVVAAMRAGVNEFLVKPLSAKTLLERMVSVLAYPRPMIEVGKYYGPKPRHLPADPLRPDQVLELPPQLATT